MQAEPEAHHQHHVTDEREEQSPPRSPIQTQQQETSTRPTPSAKRRPPTPQQSPQPQVPSQDENRATPNQHKKQGKRPKEKHFQKTPQAPNLPPLTSLRTLFNQANLSPHPLEGDVRKLGEEKTHYAEDQTSGEKV
jgi:hypothetical protein